MRSRWRVRLAWATFAMALGAAAVPAFAAADSASTVQEAPNQKAKKEIGNYRLQVDRQTKAFYLTEDAAEAAGLVIKKGHPVVQVSIYNSAEGVNKIIELPK